MPTADVNGQRIAYLDSGGDGPPVVLGHGFLMDKSMFDAQVAALGDDYRIVTWDERGFGDTEFDDQPFSYWDLAADCLGLMDHLGIDRAVVGGMSQGGFVALRVALTTPDRVRGLILLGTQAGTEADENIPLYAAMIEDWSTNGPSDELAATVAQIIITDTEHSPPWIETWQRRPRELIRQPGATLLGRDDVTDRLGEITVRALVVHGTEDQAIPMEDAEALAAGLPGAGAVVKVGGAHAANMTNPEPVNAAIGEFLGALAP
ncbi:MAG: alpha/beta hydrolase [Actinomycetota bacterium]|nr:alpha/beta hydrolase [Actinomycetota bacterium]